MPNSPHNTQRLARSLRAYLEDVLPDSRLIDAPVNSAYQPLLLLQTSHSMAAFAFANGDMRKSYAVLYEDFKQYYAAQKGRWDALDLSFVFCVQPDEPNLNLFCSKVETNVYFCRKFVVQLEPPLDLSLSRLPFLPLRPLDENSLRPASAQTFLQQCNVPALLAKYLAVQHERGPARIAEDCTTGKFGPPQRLSAANSTRSVQAESILEPVQLEAVTIDNFRAYRKPQRFEIGADITVLYGPNGFGKTSFFDAIDFAVTGGIGRFDSLRDANFAKAARHLDSKSEESGVSLYLRCGGATRKIKRTVSSRNRAELDGRPAERKTILAELMGSAVPVTDRVDHSVSLFRATHLFSQDQQELTKALQTDCQLPAHIVSRMLAFEDYANVVNKSARVCDVLRTAIADATREIKILSEQISDDKRELDRLAQTSDPGGHFESIDAELDALRAKLAALGITVGNEPTSVASLRSWRAGVESRYAQSQTRSDHLSVLVKESVALSSTRAEITRLHHRVSAEEQALEAAEQQRLACENSLQLAERRLAERSGKRAEAQAIANLLDWIRATKPVQRELTDRVRELNDVLSRLVTTLSELRDEESKAAGDLRARESEVARAAASLLSKQSEIATLKRLTNSVARWKTDRNRISAINQSEQDLLTSLESWRVEESESSHRVSALQTEEARLHRQIADLDRSQSELRILVSELKTHIRSGTCPLCGDDHGSKSNLFRRIEGHVAADIAAGARTELAVLEERVKQLIELVSINRQRQQVATTELEALKIEKVRLESDIAHFEATATKVGLTFGIQDSEPSTTVQLQLRMTQVRRDVEDLSRHVEDLRIAEATARAALENKRDLVAANIAATAEQRTALSRLDEQLGLNRDDPKQTRFSLDIEDDELEVQERLNLLRLSESKVEAANAQNEVAQEKVKATILRQEVASLKARISTLRVQLANSQRTAAQVVARFTEVNLPAEATEETLLSLMFEESRTQAQLASLRDSTSSLELAIDAATTAAALTSLRQSVRNKERAVGAAAELRGVNQPWLKYFESLSNLASSEQNMAIANFIRAYGPRTSVIQKRLRSVYGFDEIEVHSHESTISVRVRRHGEELRPTDYFSQSQQQTLSLGLFLTACSAQTASGLSPVFLDDPVTHFDDLNTYAFLDLIVGLLESEVGRRQFIISTCDDKLLQLARQKFRHFGEGAKFYHFSAIGDDGPIVEEIATSS